MHQPDPALQGANAALSTLSADLVMANGAVRTPPSCTRTPGTPGMAGHIAALLYGIPHVVTAHSLEPLRPWKAEQLGGGYRVSSWVERTAMEAADAVIAVSSGMREDVLRVYPALDPSRVHVVKNGIDTDGVVPGRGRPAVSRCSPNWAWTRRGPSWPSSAGSPGRRAWRTWSPRPTGSTPEVQLVLCAGAPDTPEIAAEVADGGAGLSAARSGVFWVREMLPIGKIREILSAATVFVCPSVYEPLGIVNLEAMACATAVVGLRCRRHSRGGRRRRHRHPGALRRRRPVAFETGLADAVNALVGDPERAAGYGRAGRQRCIDEFSWAHIAEQTLEIYRKVSS